MKKKIMTSLLLFLSSLSSQAEYRAYQYLIRNTVKKQQDSKPYVVVSSLNPRSFQAYHTGSLSVQVDLLRTWLCPGHTGHYKPICQSPYQKVEAIDEVLNGR